MVQVRDISNIKLSGDKVRSMTSGHLDAEPMPPVTRALAVFFAIA